MKFLKKKMILILCLIFAFGFVGCGDAEVPPVSGKQELKGSIVIALPLAGKDQQITQAVIDAYTSINPKVKIEYKAISNDDYKSYLETPLSSDDLSSVPFDIVMNNVIPSFLNTKKFVDFSQYLYEENPYYDNQIWADTMDEIAYQPKGAHGEIYSLSFGNTHVVFAYNKDIIKAAGVDESEFETWDGFIGACEKIAASGVTPLAIAGDMDSFYGRQMCWIVSAYVDQYFRSVAEDVHAQSSDWNYDSRLDSVWQYAPYPTLTDGMTEEETAAAWREAYYNDSFTTYTANELRTLKAMQDGELGPISKKYQNMLANLAEVFPKYTLPNFTSTDSPSTISKFLNQDAAITLQQAYYTYSSYLQRGKPFNIGFFDFPAMSSNQRYEELKDYGPDCNYTRSIGGSLGNYGIVNKSTAQTQLCIDFMMFWSSKQGQEADIAMREAIEAPMLTVPLVKGVEVPESLLFGFEPLTFRGSAESNPAQLFARGIKNESYSMSAYQRNVTALFKTSLTYNDINQFSVKMQKDIKDNLYRYLALRGYDSECLQNVSANPFI